MKWILDKYNRLADNRNMPMTIDRGPLDQLFLQFDQSIKMLCLYHNGAQLEMFFLHPLIFNHDFICKGQRLLFCIKNQADGSVTIKFRVRFATQDSVTNFCAITAQYVSIKSYEEWSQRSNASSNNDLSNISICSSQSSSTINPTVADADTSFSQPLFNNSGQNSQLSSSIDQDAPMTSASALSAYRARSHTSQNPSEEQKPLLRSRSIGDIKQQFDKDKTIIDQQYNPAEVVLVDASTQTVVDENNNIIGAGSSQSIHLHFGSMFAEEAAREFGRVLRQFANGVDANNRKLRGAYRPLKDPNKPKKPLCPYLKFMIENFDRIAETIGSRKGACVTKAAGKEWNAMTEEQKEQWKSTEEERARYRAEMAAYKERMR